MSLLRASGKMAIATLISRVLGLLRELLLAKYLGASWMGDAFWVAYRIPNLLRDLLAEGAFSSAFIPTFSKSYHQEGIEKGRLVLWSSFLSLFALCLIICSLIFIFAPFLTSFLAPSFVGHENTELFPLTVSLLRVMCWFLLVISLSALAMGALNTLKIFFYPSLSPAVFNCVMIMSLFLLWEKMGALAAAWGVFWGGVAQLFMQLPLLWKKLPPLFTKKIILPETKSVLQRLGIGVWGSAATQINHLVSTILATGTGIGAVSWLAYSFRLFQFPVGIIGVSVSNSHLIYFSEHLKKGEIEKSKKIFIQGVFLLCSILLPLTLLSFLGANDLVTLVYERGKFTSQDTLKTAQALRFYLLGLPFYGLYKLLTPCFYALDLPKTPVVVTFVGVCLNILLSFLFVPIFGFSFLALSASITIFVNVALLLWYFQKKICFNFQDVEFYSWGRWIFALSLCFIFGFLPYIFFSQQNYLFSLVRICLSFFLGFLPYFLLMGGKKFFSGQYFPKS